MAIKIPTSSIARPYKIDPNWDFCLKLNHLATLLETDQTHLLNTFGADNSQTGLPEGTFSNQKS
jgi:hypothetical protein